MAQSPERAALSAKRALLRQQLELLGEELPWLSDPTTIPADALGHSAEYGDLPYQCFNLATWMLVEIVRAANGVQQKLAWEETFNHYKVPVELRPRILRAVREPTSRHAPGIFAMAEIVAATPAVATREGVPPSGWGKIARNSERLGAKISHDGSDLQVVIRDYLRKPPRASRSTDQRVLDPTRLRLDDDAGVTSVTPIDDLVAVARAAITAHVRPAEGVCVAMLANAPACGQGTVAPVTMYSAIWSAFAAAADRLVFPHAELSRAEVPPQAGPDPHFAVAIEALARRRAAELRLGHPARGWQAARDELQSVLADRARHPQTPAYSELVQKVEALFGQPQPVGDSSEVVPQNDRR